MPTTSKKQTSENANQQVIELLAEAVHKAYCAERIRQGKKPYWTDGDYSKLDEPTKDYDRATVRAVLTLLKKPRVQAKRDIQRLLQEADEAVLAKKPIVAHSCMRLAITELEK